MLGIYEQGICFQAIIEGFVNIRIPFFSNSDVMHKLAKIIRSPGALGCLRVWNKSYSLVFKMQINKV